MKDTKLYFGLFLLILIVFGFAFRNNVQAANVNIYIDNRPMNVENIVISENGSTYISLVTFANEINAKTSWNEHTRQTTIVYNDKTIIIDTFKGTVSTDGKVANEKVLLRYGRIMVPIRFITEQFGFNVSWNSSKNNIDITSKIQIPILMYHAIDPTGNKNDTLWVTTSQFDLQMKALKNAGYNTITPFELYDYYYKGISLPSNPILITFDDGYENNKYAYPILKKYGQKATIFGIISRIEHEGANSYPTEIQKLSWEDYYEMRDVFTLQSHTWDSHKQATSPNGKQRGIISDRIKIKGDWESEEQAINRITNDLTKAQDEIYQNMGYKSVMIAYPFGQYSDITLQAADSIGIGLGVTIKSGKNGIYSEKYELTRIKVDGKNSGKKLIQKIKGH